MNKKNPRDNRDGKSWIDWNVVKASIIASLITNLVLLLLLRLASR
jgi:hypothetical protein